jgi:hypothetical protein
VSTTLLAQPISASWPRHFPPRVTAKQAPVSCGPHTTASLLHGRKLLRTRPATAPGTLPNPSPSSAPASRHSPVQSQSTGHPRAVPQRFPTESPPLRHLAPSRTEMSPCAAAHVCRCHTQIVAMPSEHHHKAWGRRLTDKPGTRQGAHAPPRLSALPSQAAWLQAPGRVPCRPPGTVAGKHV